MMSLSSAVGAENFTEPMIFDPPARAFTETSSMSPKAPK
eukprot:CAMPEP_0204039092 /NCGR_PEP_ID=MMETSP0360-20130528/89963_1 /ASSEMBLY_ACC=CAM_ASM_000342 /TAXON_ID=268821 /ORGANISM="Scrippsiella Hangoei, Strain SHTV-5" /LENGTH=38 /DNA_ID= /DNA_START= /DNA_END= /DNA_ORIENTATION=